MNRSRRQNLMQCWRASVMGLGTLIVAAGCADEATPQQASDVETKQEAIVGGSIAIPYSFPFQAYLYITQADGRITGCGGALLNQRWVITAAHCVDGGIQGLYAFMGMHHVLPPLGEDDVAPFPDDYESFYAVYPPGPNIVFHPNWTGSPTPPHYDMALLKLQGTVSFTTRVQPIAVAPVGATGSTYATGWGSTKGDDPLQQYSEYLKVAAQPVRSTATCNASGVGAIRSLYSDEICAGYGNGANPYKGACNGDSGGPFFRQSGSTRDLLGVTSWGTHYCTDYVVYSKANSTSTRSWIINTIAQVN